jgi:hypothetical protein
MVRLALLRSFAGAAAMLCVLTPCHAGGGSILGSGPNGVCAQTGGPAGSNFLPGKYWEDDAKDRLDRDDTTGALEAFKHAAYYGNRDALYDIAMLHLKGARKIPVNVAIGVAWLRVAERYNHKQSIDALRKLEPALTPDEYENSMREFAVLYEKYNVATTRNRTMKTYQLERGHIMFADYVCRDGMAVTRDTFVAEIEQEFTNYVTTMFGTVTVDPIQPLPPPANPK